MDIVGTLKRSELFCGLHDEDIQLIADLPSCQAKSYDVEEIICRAGDEAKYIYLLEEGQVNMVLKQPNNLTRATIKPIVRTITKGGIFGWTALIPPHIRITSAICKVPCKVISINGNELRALFDRKPRVGYEVMSSLVKLIGFRVWDIEQLLTTGKGLPLV